MLSHGASMIEDWRVRLSELGEETVRGFIFSCSKCLEIAFEFSLWVKSLFQSIKTQHN